MNTNPFPDTGFENIIFPSLSLFIKKNQFSFQEQQVLILIRSNLPRVFFDIFVSHLCYSVKEITA